MQDIYDSFERHTVRLLSTVRATTTSFAVGSRSRLERR